MPTGETSFDKSTWDYGKWGHGAANTNPGAKKSYIVTVLSRVVLDNAHSVAEAKEIIESINWYEPVNFPHKGESQSFHWLLCDSTTSCVLEFIDNKPCYTETTEVNKPSYATIMTNFTNKLMADKQMMQDGAQGYERYDVIKDNYDATPATFEGMQDLMKKVWFSLSYTKDLKDPGFFHTDYANNAAIKASEVYNNPDVLKNEAFVKEVENGKANFADKSQWHKKDCTLWYTTHTSVYDLENKTLRVLVHEGLDEQKTNILGIDVPTTTIPVKPGRNLAVILEIAAMNNRQKKLGYNAAHELMRQLGMEEDEPQSTELEIWQQY